MLRAGEVANGLAFLRNPRTQSTALSGRVSFLEQKGLTPEEIAECLRQLNDTTTTTTTTSDLAAVMSEVTGNGDSGRTVIPSPPPPLRRGGGAEVPWWQRALAPAAGLAAMGTVAGGLAFAYRNLFTEPPPSHMLRVQRSDGVEEFITNPRLQQQVGATTRGGGQLHRHPGSGVEGVFPPASDVINHDQQMAPQQQQQQQIVPGCLATTAGEGGAAMVAGDGGNASGDVGQVVSTTTNWTTGAAAGGGGPGAELSVELRRLSTVMERQANNFGDAVTAMRSQASLGSQVAAHTAELRAEISSLKVMLMQLQTQVHTRTLTDGGAVDSGGPPLAILPGDADDEDGGGEKKNAKRSKKRKATATVDDGGKADGEDGEDGEKEDGEEGEEGERKRKAAEEKKEEEEAKRVAAAAALVERVQAVRVAMSALRANNPDPEIALPGCNMLQMYVNNLVDKPTVPRYRRILMTNTNFKKCIKPLDGHMELLKSIGFRASGSYLDWGWAAAAAGGEKDANCEAMKLASKLIGEWSDGISSTKREAAAEPGTAKEREVVVAATKTATAASAGGAGESNAGDDASVSPSPPTAPALAAPADSTAVPAQSQQQQRPPPLESGLDSATATVVDAVAEIAVVEPSQTVNAAPATTNGDRSAPPYSQSFSEIMNMVQSGQEIEGIKTVEDRLSSDSPSAAQISPQPKPWEC